MQNCRVASDSHEKSKTFSGLGFPGKNVQKSSLIKGAGLGGKMSFFRENFFFESVLNPLIADPQPTPPFPKKIFPLLCPTFFSPTAF